MKVSVIAGCIACGACESICPDVFEVLDTSYVTEAAIMGNEDACREASDVCPVSVIKIEE